jgi:hypothetical protein
MTEREVGELSVRVTAIEKSLQALASDVREIRDALLTFRGGNRMLALLVASAASLGAGIATLIPALFGR